MFEEENVLTRAGVDARRDSRADPAPGTKPGKSAPGRKPYTPQFSEMAVVSVRRLAWAIGKPMPKAVDLMVRLLPSIVDPSKVCLSCQDNAKCQECIFHGIPTQEEKAALLAAL
jgi:hypothetical protein